MQPIRSLQSTQACKLHLAIFKNHCIRSLQSIRNLQPIPSMQPILEACNPFETCNPFLKHATHSKLAIHPSLQATSCYFKKSLHSKPATHSKLAIHPSLQATSCKHIAFEACNPLENCNPFQAWGAQHSKANQASFFPMS